MGGPLNFLFFFPFFQFEIFFLFCFTQGDEESYYYVYILLHMSSVWETWKGAGKNFFFLFSYLDTKKTDTYSVRNRVGWAQQLFLLSRFITTEISYERKWEFTHSCRDDDSIIFFFFQPQKKWNEIFKVVTRKKKKCFVGRLFKDVDSFVHFSYPHTHEMKERKESYALLRRYVCVCVLAESNERAAPLGSPPSIRHALPTFFFSTRHTQKRKKKMVVLLFTCVCTSCRFLFF